MRESTQSITRRSPRYSGRRIGPGVSGARGDNITTHSGIERVVIITGTNRKGCSKVANRRFGLHLQRYADGIADTSIGSGCSTVIDGFIGIGGVVQCFANDRSGAAAGIGRNA